MKIILVTILALSLSGTYAFYYIENAKRSAINNNERLLAKKKFSIGCSPRLSEGDLNDPANAIPLLTGWGKHNMRVSTKNDSANIYFQQGINMYYSFHIIEAMASFQKAVAFDSSFAMGYWGKALAFGPNINDFGYSASPEALTAVAKAKQFSAACTDVEKGLIYAMETRYSADSAQSRSHLDQLYADAMKNLYTRWSNNADVGALYADALMVQHPWDLYTQDYRPKPWTQQIVNTLESILKRFPNHPGASHYYIHAIEASAQPEKGLAAAKKLPQLMPGVSHVVHMPSHIYIRSGYYAQGEKVNKQAVKSYYDYAGKFKAVKNNAPLYLVHNLHMQATCANMNGNFKQAWKASVDCKNSFDSTWQGMEGFMGIYIQYIYMTPVFTLIRFGKWTDILATPEPPAAHVYANLIWHYARGLAFARRHDFQKANDELNALSINLKHDQMIAPAPSYANPGITGGTLARTILEGVIAEEQNQLSEAERLLQIAVRLEENMIYNEPKDWVHPARQYFGNVLLKRGKYEEAERVYKSDLKINPANGWSLTGLATALSRQKRNKELFVIKQKRAKAFSEADVVIKTSVF